MLLFRTAHQKKAHQNNPVYCFGGVPMRTNFTIHILRTSLLLCFLTAFLPFCSSFLSPGNVDSTHRARYDGSIPPIEDVDLVNRARYRTTCISENDLHSFLRNLQVVAVAYAPVDSVQSFTGTWNMLSPPEAYDKAQVWVDIGVLTEDCHYFMPGVIWNFWNFFDPSGRDLWNLADASYTPFISLDTQPLEQPPANETASGKIEESGDRWKITSDDGITPSLVKYAVKRSTPTYLLVALETWDWTVTNMQANPYDCSLYPKGSNGENKLEFTSLKLDGQPVTADWKVYLTDPNPCEVSVVSDGDNVTMTWTKTD